MVIRYQPKQNTALIEIRDITGGNELATWHRGQERDVTGVTVQFRDAEGHIGQRDAAEVLFACGPDFVDAKTGRNPNFVCARCAADAFDDHLTNRHTLEVVPIADADGARLCMTCWLSDHIEYQYQLRDFGFDKNLIAKAIELAAARFAKPASAPARPVPVVVPDDAAKTAEQGA